MSKHHRNRNWAPAPQPLPEDAHVIDSSNLTIDGVVGEIVGRLKLKGLQVD